MRELIKFSFAIYYSWCIYMRIYKSFARSIAVEPAGYITEARNYGKNRARDIALYKIHCARIHG